MRKIVTVRSDVQGVTEHYFNDTLLSSEPFNSSSSREITANSGTFSLYQYVKTEGVSHVYHYGASGFTDIDRDFCVKSRPEGQFFDPFLRVNSPVFVGYTRFTGSTAKKYFDCLLERRPTTPDIQNYSETQPGLCIENQGCYRSVTRWTVNTYPTSSIVNYSKQVLNNSAARGPNGEQLLCDLLDQVFDYVLESIIGGPNRDCSRVRVRGLPVARVRVRC
jgi:hypothetical protein